MPNNSESKDGQILSLTQSQHLFWSGQILSPKSSMYNMAMLFKFQTTIDESIFKIAFSELVNKVDAMRITIDDKEGIPTQTINSGITYQLEILDWSDKSISTEQIQHWSTNRTNLIFDLSEVLFDAILIKVSKDQYYWYMNQHHLITDAWSFTLQFRLFEKIYNNLSNGTVDLANIQLPSYKEYIAYEATSRNKEGSKSRNEYWANKSKSFPLPPAINNAKSITKSRSNRVSITLTKNKIEQLKTIMQIPEIRSWTFDLSMFNVYASLMFILIYRMTNQEHLTIGVPSHNRLTPGFKNTIGLFIELFPLDIKINGNESLIDVIIKTKASANELLKHSHTGSSNSSSNKAFNLILNYINVAYDSSTLPMEATWIHSGHVDPSHHVRLQICDFNDTGEIELSFDLNTEVFNDEQQNLFAENYRSLIDGLIADPNQAIGTPSLSVGHNKSLTNHEQLLNYDSSVTIIDIFEDNIKDTPSNLTALTFQGSATSYPDLNSNANQLAHYLQQNGLHRGDRVIIFLDRSPLLVVSILAVMKAGAIFIPIPASFPLGRVLSIINDADPKLILSNTQISENFPSTLTNLIKLDIEGAFIQQHLTSNTSIKVMPSDIAYIMYTSGSTGKPKGVMISHKSLSHYIQWAKVYYTSNAPIKAPLFTSIGFDLTITSLFLPLLSNGELHIYPETPYGPDLSLYDVIEDNKVDFIKLTPSHIRLLSGSHFTAKNIATVIVGGEEFKSNLLNTIEQRFGTNTEVYNEYGPTEATVGCIVHKVSSLDLTHSTSIPIGVPLPNTDILLLDQYNNQVPVGSIGELHIAGAGLANGYWQQEALTNSTFNQSPYLKESIAYKTGDLARINENGIYEYFGRKDLQVKIRGRRVELGEIESAINEFPGIQESIVDFRSRLRDNTNVQVDNCNKCGLPTNYPNVTFDTKGICSICTSFEKYQEKLQGYFKTLPDLDTLIRSANGSRTGKYDCLVLLSGGKDSTYTLAKIKEMGFNILAFTLDNGYISEEAKDNVRRVVKQINVDHIFAQTEAMNEIFVDSLQNFKNVCDGCFKTIYTLAVQEAIKHQIPFIITGLSRGQFFETRLTEELFNSDDVDFDKIDDMILEARKAYHKKDDAVSRLLDVSMFEDDDIFKKIRFVDFFRYTDISLPEMYEYLDAKLPWVRPSDTGRSTNCLINKAGIYIHKKEKGYSNYAFPYSWDVRVGHKTRDESLDEINEEIPENEALKILDEIGYTKSEEETNSEQLVAYYISSRTINEQELKSFLSASFPDYMIPVQFIKIEHIPITNNGKTDFASLPVPDTVRPIQDIAYVAPETDLESLITEIWSTVLNIDKIGIDDSFIVIGGDSLSAIRIIALLSSELGLELEIVSIFNAPTIRTFAKHIEGKMLSLMNED